MDKDLGGQLIDLPGLTSVFAGDRCAGDVARERGHGGIRSISAKEGDMVPYERVSRCHQGKGASHASTEQAASVRINIGLLDEPVVCQRLTN